MDSLTETQFMPLVRPAARGEVIHEEAREQHQVLGTRVDVVDYEEATETLIRWAERGASRYYCACNIHMVMEGFDDWGFQALVNDADLVTADSIGVVAALSLLRRQQTSRVCGPDLTLKVCEAAAAAGLPIGLYGATEACLANLEHRLRQMFPALEVACRIAPPFRELTEEEQWGHIEAINQSGARILLVGLGCPKQERWMAAHKGRVKAVMMGVGAAFDFHSGQKRRAPVWMRRLGMEWLFRLLQEPRRLWKRNLKHAPRFLMRVGYVAAMTWRHGVTA